MVLMPMSARMRFAYGTADVSKSSPLPMVRPRSAVTSGRQLFIDGDPNSAWARRFHDSLIGHVNDLGGADMLSDAQILADPPRDGHRMRA